MPAGPGRALRTPPPRCAAHWPPRCSAGPVQPWPWALWAGSMVTTWAPRCNALTRRWPGLKLAQAGRSIPTAAARPISLPRPVKPPGAKACSRPCNAVPENWPAIRCWTRRAACCTWRRRCACACKPTARRYRPPPGCPGRCAAGSAPTSTCWQCGWLWRQSPATARPGASTWRCIHWPRPVLRAGCAPCWPVRAWQAASCGWSWVNRPPSVPRPCWVSWRPCSSRWAASWGLNMPAPGWRNWTGCANAGWTM